MHLQWAPTFLLISIHCTSNTILSLALPGPAEDLRGWGSRWREEAAWSDKSFMPLISCRWKERQFRVHAWESLEAVTHPGSGTHFTLHIGGPGSREEPIQAEVGPKKRLWGLSGRQVPRPEFTALLHDAPTQEQGRQTQTPKRRLKPRRGGPSPSTLNPCAHLHTHSHPTANTNPGSKCELANHLIPRPTSAHLAAVQLTF